MTGPESFDDQQDGAGGAGLLEQLPGILWQRRWWIIVPTVIGAVAALIAMVVMPSVYRSSAVMLVRSSQLPGEVVAMNDNEIVDRRIARIRQQVTSRPDLVALIERHALYRDERSSKPLSKIIKNMREAITLTPTEAELPGGQSQQRTIAFQLSFDYSEPALAQAVAQDLMDRILELDASGNVEQATNTVQFLTDQAKGLEDQIVVLQGQIGEMNARFGGILGNSGLGILGGNTGSYDVQIAALQRENASLIAQLDVVKSADTRDPVVVAAETQLAAARAVYAESHPDVIFAKQRLAEARELARSNTQKLPTQTVDQQIAFNNSQIATLRAAKSQELAQINARLSAQSRAPLVQQQIGELQQRLAGLNQQYEGVQARLLAAKAGVRAEDEQMGERLSVVEPPIIPDTPIWPDRLLIAAAGIGGGLALGFLLALAIELFLRPIRDPSALAGLVGEAPLAVVPVIKPRPRPGRPAHRLAFWRRAN